MINRLKQNLINKNKTIVFPEGNDERILKASQMLVQENIAKIIVLGDEEEILTIAKNNNIEISGIEIINIKKQLETIL